MVMIPPQEWQNISDVTQHERWTDIRVVMNHCSCLGSRLYQAVTSDLLGLMHFVVQQLGCCYACNPAHLCAVIHLQLLAESSSLHCVG